MTGVHTHWPASRLVQNPVLRPAISPLHIASWTKGSSVDTVTGVSVFLSLMPLSGTTCTTQGLSSFTAITVMRVVLDSGYCIPLGEGRLIWVTVPAIALALETSLFNAFFIEAGILGASFATTFCLTGSITACGSSLSAHQGVL